MGFCESSSSANCTSRHFHSTLYKAWKRALAPSCFGWHPQTAMTAPNNEAAANATPIGLIETVSTEVFPMILSPPVTRKADKHTSDGRLGSLPVRVALLLEEGAVDMLRVQVDVAGSHATLRKMILPAIYHPHHAAHLADGFILGQGEHAGHRQGIVDS